MNLWLALESLTTIGEVRHVLTKPFLSSHLAAASISLPFLFSKFQPSVEIAMGLGWC